MLETLFEEIVPPALLIEALLVSGIAIILGYVVGKRQGALHLALITLVANVTFILLAIAPFYPGHLPLHQLELSWGEFPRDSAPYLVNTYLVLEITLGATVLAGALGYFFNGWVGAIMLESGLIVTGMFCATVASTPFDLLGIRNPTWMLGVAIVFVSTVGVGAFGRAMSVKDKGIQLVLLLVGEVMLYVLMATVRFSFFGIPNTAWALLPAIVFIITLSVVAFGRDRLKARAGELLILFAVGAILSFAVAILPFDLFKIPNTTWAAGIAIVFLIAMAFVAYSEAMLKQKMARTLMVASFGLCVSCWAGYRIAGQIGLLLITLAADIGFWIALRRFAAFAVPTENEEQSAQVFQSLLTFSLGTNYPFYVIKDWKKLETAKELLPEPCVPGNIFGQFFAGPGIVLTGCDHLAVTTEGRNLTVHPPGLGFTHQFERLYADVDLRPQLRATTIKAVTKDGIAVKIFTFMPHRIWADERSVALGQSYPFDEDAVRRAVYKHAVVEHSWERDSTGRAIVGASQTPWHELILKVSPPILKDIISTYTCNELHMTSKDPDRFKYPQDIDGIGGAFELEALSAGDYGGDADKIRQYLALRFSYDEIKDLAFDLGAGYEVLQKQTEEELARALANAMKPATKLGCLVVEVWRRRPGQYLPTLFSKLRHCSPPQKVQLILDPSDQAGLDLSELQAALAHQFGTGKGQISIIGATQGNTRILVGIPEKQLASQDLAQINSLGKYQKVSMIACDDLDPAGQRAWRFAACAGLRAVSWEDALTETRERDPRGEIAGKFVARLREEMKPLGIDVIGGGISNIVVEDPAVLQQRIENWKAKRERDIEIAVAEAEARAKLQIGQIRYELEQELLTELAQILEKVDKDKEHVRMDALALELWGSMDRRLGVSGPPPTELIIESGDV